MGERRGATAVTRIRVMVYPVAAHDSSHVLVTIQRPGQPDLVEHCPSQRTIDFEVYRAGSESRTGSILERFFTLHLDPSRYRVSVESCGIRDSGTPVGSGHLEVLVYPYDQYTLTLSVPPIGRRSYSHSSTRTVTGTQTTTTSRDRADGVSTTDSTVRERDGTVTRSRSTTTDGFTVSRRDSSTPLGTGSLDIRTLHAEEATPDPPTLELKKNGAAEDVTANISAIIRTISSVESAVRAIRELIRNYVPQFGFRFEASISFIQGSFNLGWGWKENSDHQVYFGFVGSVSLWIFKIGLTLSFGVSIGPSSIRVLGTIPDAGLNITSNWDLRRPGRPVLPPTARGSLVIPMEVSGDATLDIYVARYSAAAGIRSGFTAEGGTRLNDASEVELFANVAWTGLDAFIRTESPGAGTGEDLYHLIDQNELYSGKIPI